jgi:hypothetical protein
VGERPGTISPTASTNFSACGGGSSVTCAAGASDNSNNWYSDVVASEGVSFIDAAASATDVPSLRVLFIVNQREKQFDRLSERPEAGS